MEISNQDQEEKMNTKGDGYLRCFYFIFHFQVEICY